MTTNRQRRDIVAPVPSVHQRGVLSCGGHSHGRRPQRCVPRTAAAAISAQRFVNSPNAVRNDTLREYSIEPY